MVSAIREVTLAAPVLISNTPPFHEDHRPRATGFRLLASGIPCAQASDGELLQRAVNCQLRDNELSSLVKKLADQRPDLKKPTAQYGAPAADVYELTAPVSAYGYTSAQLVITPARLLLAVSGKTVGEAAGALHAAVPRRSELMPPPET